MSGALVGVEALLRWQHPQFGMVLPGEFMPMLEETGLIVPVGEWVLQTACKQLRAWHNSGWGTLRMAVNLSARQFGSKTLIDSVDKALAVMGGNPAHLELEITESIFMQHAMATAKTLSELFAMGCRLAIDDFGTGYSSLAYLKRFPINVIKIDHSFVRDIPDDKDDGELVSTIIAMAHNLKIEVVAEGVETEAQISFLRACGCDCMQGYFFSRPLPAEEVVHHF
jgi:EAL domain-containing protein (putative c-di-GMP-specific phosphodiesterase class I)